jgi:hypothetical protein
MLARLAGHDNRTSRLERDTNLLKWMIGAVIAVQLGTFWMQWQALDRLSGIEAQLSAIELELALLSERLETP